MSRLKGTAPAQGKLTKRGKKKRAKSQKPRRLGVLPLVFLGVLFLVFVVMVALRAWQSDDAYIAWRSADNLVAGRGLTYNPGERVQVFTSPLWFLVGALCQFVFGEVYFSVIFLSVVIVSIAVAAVLNECRFRGTIPATILLVAVGSSAVLDFSTSGLETPLLALLVVAFCLAVARDEWRRALWWTALLYLCRPDTFAFTAVPLFLMWRTRSHRRAATREVLAPAAVVLAWTSFATFYFGSPVPNTALAKLNSDVSLASTWGQGLTYLLDFAQNDLIAATLIVAVAGFTLVRGEPKLRGIAWGVCLHLLYVVWVGGDFMRGRFLWVPLWASFALVATVGPRLPRRALEAALFVAAVGVVLPWSPVFSVDPRGGGQLDQNQGIVDERAFYASTTSLLSVFYLSDSIEKYDLPVPPYRTALECAAHRGQGRQYAYLVQVGFCGYFGGPELLIFDWAAVVDPFLARVPYISQEDYRPGHLYRHNLPPYVKRRRGELKQFSDQGVEAAYRDVQLVARGPLFSGRRLGAIGRLLIGTHREAFRRFEEAGEALPEVLLRPLE